MACHNRTLTMSPLQIPTPTVYRTPQSIKRTAFASTPHMAFARDLFVLTLSHVCASRWRCARAEQNSKQCVCDILLHYGTLIHFAIATCDSSYPYVFSFPTFQVMDSRIQHLQDNQSDVANYEDLTEDLLDRMREGDYLEMLRKLKLDLADKSDECEMLKIELDKSNQDVESLSQELNQCKLTMFENNEDSRKTHEEFMKSKKIEEDYVKLMSDFLELGERSEQQRLNLYDNYLAKSNAINNLECLMSSGALKNELDECKIDLDKKSAELNLALAKIRHLEEDGNAKEKCITELRKTLDDAKVTHKHEITVLEEYIQCLKNTISSYENTLADYIEPKSEGILAEAKFDNTS